jgi:hypothetical protein
VIVRQLVAQGGPGQVSMAAEIGAALSGAAFDRLDVAVAYATRPGLEALRRAIGGWPAGTRWVVGLDDAITQPEALADIAALPATELRVASLAGEGRRFHPKLYCLWSSADPAACLAVIGSANMTGLGLNRNGEVGVILVAETAAEAARLKAMWTEMNALGHAPTASELDAYRDAHAKAREARRRMARIGAVPPHPEAEEDDAGVPPFDGDPASATVAWTEGATPSAGGRDLEFPRAMMPFFHLRRSPEERRLRMRNRRVFTLTFTMREDNQMWRLMFSRDAIAAGIGRETLRPVTGGNRSDLAIVFTRSTAAGADYDVDLVVIGSPEHAALIARTRALGILERTRDPGGRYFGFY